MESGARDSRHLLIILISLIIIIMGLCLFSSVLNETVKNDIKLEELRRGAIVGQKRQGMQWHELEDLEDAMENDVRRRIDENGETE